MDEEGRAHMADESGLDEWQRAMGVGDLGRLTARWLEGDLTYHPGSSAPAPANGRVTVLAVLNRACFFTTWSQPGVSLVEGRGRRAAVGGFCDREVTGQIQQATLATELVVLAFPPSVLSNGLHIPVTIHDGAAHAWIGTVTSGETIEESYGGRVGAQAVLALKEAWQVTAFDPAWEDRDLLWTTLAVLGREPATEAPGFP